MAWMEMDYSKHVLFRWKIKWQLEHLGALGIMAEFLNFVEFFSLTNSFSVDTSKRISTAMWAMKVMDAAHSTNPAVYQEMIVKVGQPILHFSACC